MVSKDSIGIDKDLTKDRNLNIFKMYCKRRKSSARFPDRKARNPLCACHCIAGNDLKKACTVGIGVADPGARSRSRTGSGW